MKIGVADFGMNVWYGGCFDPEQRLRELKTLGFDGIERVEAVDAADALNQAMLQLLQNQAKLLISQCSSQCPVQRSMMTTRLLR